MRAHYTKHETWTNGTTNAIDWATLESAIKTEFRSSKKKYSYNEIYVIPTIHGTGVFLLWWSKFGLDGRFKCVPIYSIGGRTQPGFMFRVVCSHADCGPCCLYASIVVICNEIPMDEDAHFCGWCDCGCWWENTSGSWEECKLTLKLMRKFDWKESD